MNAMPRRERKLNPEQEAAAAFNEGQLLILAPAGTGKTETMTTRIVRLIGEGMAKPDEVLALTFTNKAAREMQTRIGASLIGRGCRTEAPYMPQVGTFHRIGLDMLRAAPHLAGLKPGFGIASDEQMLDIVKAAMVKGGHKAKRKNRFAADPVKLVAEKFARIKDDGFRPADAAEWLRNFTASNAAETAYAGIAAVIAPNVQASLRRRNLADFGDMVLWPTLALEEDATYRQDWAGRCRFVLVDEYQDVNNIQYRFARVSASVHRNIAVVGDDDQNLYTFRGASQEYILQFTTDWPEAKTVSLCRNYRSAQPILDAAGSLIAHNENRFAKQMIAAGQANGEHTTTARAVVTATECRNAAHEAEVVVRGIVTRDPGIALDNVGILVRSAYLGRVLEDALRVQGVGFSIVGGVSFYRRKEILDALALMTLAQFPETDEGDDAFRRMFNTPARGLGPAVLAKIAQIAQEDGSSLMAAAEQVCCQLPSKQSEPLRDWLLALDAATGDSPGQILQNLLETTGYLPMIANGSTAARERVENLTELCGLADRFADAFSFLEHCVAAGTEADVAGDYGRVQLTTIHGAKGLEYDMVYVVGCAEGHFPSARTLAAQHGLEEERRLAYVAITRARKECHLTWPRFAEGRKTPSQPSRFIAEAEIEASPLSEACAPPTKRGKRRWRRSSAPKKRWPATAKTKTSRWGDTGAWWAR